MSRIKAKFGKKLWQLDDERHAAEASTSSAVRSLEEAIVATKEEASTSACSGPTVLLVGLGKGVGL